MVERLRLQVWESILDPETAGLFLPLQSRFSSCVYSLTPVITSRNVSEPLKGNRQTNQRAELTAILRALDIAPRHRDVTIFTDSQYSIKCVTEWFQSWRRNNWITSSNKAVENKDLIESILDKIEERDKLKVKTFFEWIKGHSKDPGNEAADRLAVNGAQRGVADKQAAMETVQDIPDDAFDDEFE